jgi:hypothetical protein
LWTFFRSPKGGIAIEEPVCVAAFRNDFESLFLRVFHGERQQFLANAFSSKGLMNFRVGDNHSVI